MRIEDEKKSSNKTIVSEAAATKIKDDYIQSTKGGVLNGIIPSIIADSGASSSTDENSEDYEATGEKSPK